MLLADVQRCPDLQCIVGVFSLFSPMFRAGHAFFFLASPCHHQEKISQFGLPLPSSVDPITGEGAGSTLPSSHPNTGEGAGSTLPSSHPNTGDWGVSCAVFTVLHWRAASPAGSVVKLNRSIFDAVTRTNKLCIPSSGYYLQYCTLSDITWYSWRCCVRHPVPVLPCTLFLRFKILYRTYVLYCTC